MAIEVKVPLLPESITDATVSTWHKKAGDKVSRDENIVDLETDKVMLEVPSPTDGIIKEIIKNTGSTVQAQEVIAVIDAVAASEKPAAEKEKASATTETVVKTAKASGDTQAPNAGPAARRVIAEHDIDASQVTGTGKGGRIT